MIKLKNKKEEKSTNYSQDVDELFLPSEVRNNVFKYQDIKNTYKKHKEELQHKEMLESVMGSGMSFLFMLSLTMHWWDSILRSCFLLMFCISGAIGMFINEKQRKSIRKWNKDNEHVVIDVKDVLKNIFYERYKKENSVEIIENKLVQYIINNLDKTNMSYKEFLKLNLNDEYEKLKEQYVQLKNKKEGNNILRSLYD